MRALIIFLMLLAPSLTWADARMLFLAASGQFETYTFEGNTDEGWTGTTWLPNGYAHTGSYSLAAQAGVTPKTTSMTLTTRAGYLDFWHDCGELGLGTFKVIVNGTDYELTDNAGWVHSTNIPVSAGSTTITFHVDSSTGTPFAHVDDIRIPTSSGAYYADNFDRADGAATAPWFNTSGQLTIVSNQAKNADAILRAAHGYDGTFSNDQYAQADAVNGVASPVVYLSKTEKTYYRFTASASSCGIYKVINDSSTSITSTGACTVVNGDTVKLTIEDGTLNGYVNGNLIRTVVNTEITTGYPGLYFANQSAVAVDNFVCGDIL